jgi:hypothetical protein
VLTVHAQIVIDLTEEAIYRAVVDVDPFTSPAGEILYFGEDNLCVSSAPKAELSVNPIAFTQSNWRKGSPSQKAESTIDQNLADEQQK